MSPRSESLWKAAERNIVMGKALVDMVNIERLREGKPEQDVKLCFDEVSRKGDVGLSVSGMFGTQLSPIRPKETSNTTITPIC